MARKDGSKMDKKKVAFICVHNSCRSQIAEALGKHFAADKYDFSSTFSNYADYSTDADFDSIEESLIIEILDKIIDDIYNKALVNW